MTSVRHSLRFRLASTFAVFGALVSLLLSLGLFFTAHNLGERLMDETLRAEIEDYMSRRSRNPNSLPPATISVRGYVHVPGRGAENIPPELLRLNPGKYQLTLANIPYRVAVVDQGDERYVMLFNEMRQRQREELFLIYLVAGALIMTLVSAAIGWWLAGRVVAPVATLARRVDKARPEDEVPDVAKGFSSDEIGKLARVFDGYLRRMRAFMDRERAFTADVSHELRTPLAIIQGAVELMEEDDSLDEKQQKRIARVGRAARQMIDLTAALLLMAREKTSDEPVEQECDVCDVVRDVVEAHRYLVSATTNVEIDYRSRPRISAERTLLSIVIANLIRNAFTYTESGSVFIQVDDNCLTVTDTGRGIHEEEIGKVFQRHFKGSTSTGAGIGLSLVKRICDRYGWETVIDSTEGRGTAAQLFFIGNS
ncbi:sensor histidine kinase [Sulfuricella denitrificans]|uniref:sensor histidine kinase n=1 Tax=Sulfuricella denitrificans TaxID=649841 RepID=UPI00137749D2|nr:HAMP domain-containing sensor histidine kinase [Sulfuricella denitrificans]